MSVERVVLIGRDAPLWLCARALGPALQASGKTLAVIELPSVLQPHEAVVVSPSLALLHRRLGIDTDALVRVTDGQPIGGQYYRNWSHASFLLGIEEPLLTPEGVDVGQYWAVERLAGATVPRDRLSPASVAMAQGRLPDGKGRFVEAPAFHLDAADYANALRKGARVEPKRSVTCQPMFEDGRLVAIALDNGEHLSGDLFIDASGSEGLLIGESPSDDWCARTAIPTRSLRWTSAPPLAPRPPFTDLNRTDGGWQARYPLAKRTAICTANDSDGTPFEAGRRRPWQANVVAIGDAACRVEPLDQLSLHAVHVGIASLMAWFPASDDMAPERERYNLSVEGSLDQMLDFQQCRYDLTSPDPSGALARRLSLFRTIGTVPAIDDDPFDPGHWERYFAGLSLVPRSASVQALALPTARRHALLAAIVADIDRDASERPLVTEALSR